MTFKDLMYESFNPNISIKETYIKDNVTFYVLDKNEMSDKEYRVFVEKVDNDIHIGFERKLNNEWNIYDITNDLQTKEILGLFGTVIDIVEKYKADTIMFRTENYKKGQMYWNITRKIASKFNYGVSRDDNIIVLYLSLIHI